jgi:hypothetical protein
MCRSLCGLTSRKLSGAAQALLLSMLATAVHAQGVLKSDPVFIGGANAMSTPAARHAVRIDYLNTFLMAINHDHGGADSSHQGLWLWKTSDYNVQAWSEVAPISGSTSDRDTVDMVVTGSDLLMVISWDSFDISPNASLDRNRKITFQRWSYQSAGNTWVPTQTTRIMDPCPAGYSCPANYAYHRGEIAVDSHGVIWVQGWLRGPNATVSRPDGNGYPNTLEVAYSTDGGVTFSSQVGSDGILHGQVLGNTSLRAGGRLIHANGQIIMFWNDYSESQPTRLRFRSDASPVTSAWSSEGPAFSDGITGIYHGAALSAVAQDNGILHLVYKDQNSATMRLWYAQLNGATDQFGPSTQVDDASGDWAQQPATTIYAGRLLVFANHVVPGPVEAYDTRMWRAMIGFGASNAILLDNADSNGDAPAACTPTSGGCFFNGYPTMPERLPIGISRIPYFFGRTPDSGLHPPRPSNGTERILSIDPAVTCPYPAVYCTCSCQPPEDWGCMSSGGLCTRACANACP